MRVLRSCFGASFDDGYQNRLEAVENVGHGLLPVEEAPRADGWADYKMLSGRTGGNERLGLLTSPAAPGSAGGRGGGQGHRVA